MLFDVFFPRQPIPLMTDPNDQHTDEESFFPLDDLADSVQAMYEHMERVDEFLEEFSGSDDE
jgi:hypothetical protein